MCTFTILQSWRENTYPGITCYWWGPHQTNKQGLAIFLLEDLVCSFSFNFWLIISEANYCKSLQIDLHSSNPILLRHPQLTPEWSVWSTILTVLQALSTLWFSLDPQQTPHHADSCCAAFTTPFAFTWNSWFHHVVTFPHLLSLSPGIIFWGSLSELLDGSAPFPFALRGALSTILTSFIQVF